ncbi:hypothetical protein [Aureivirga sp. CE67]|uniref:hypothetical protein n=1 Tax=Aureivirga sp. CE67 TaxID=1788983 RepID=UPI0018C9112A|nr:hypothetical protein [Aureivirga sp. CE67]
MKTKKFNSPAFWAEHDVPSELLPVFHNRWNNYVNSCTENSLLGDVWSSTNNAPRSFYYNYTTVEDGEPTNDNTMPVQWSAFPNRIKFYFSNKFQKYFTPNNPTAEEKLIYLKRLYELADIGPAAFSEKYNVFMDIPKSRCNLPVAFINAPLLENTDEVAKAKQTKEFDLVQYDPIGPRGWQDEYCEWSVERNKEGQITAINFTHENPEYWFFLWEQDPNNVLKLYQNILKNDTIQLSDLYLLDKKGNPVIEEQTGRPAYNPINKWNYGTAANKTKGGAIHLTSNPNTLGAEIELGAGATMLRKDVNGNPIIDVDALICAGAFGRPFRNSDPRIGQSVNAFVRNVGLRLGLTNPIGLYGQQPERWDAFQLPDSAKGLTIQDLYTVVRGLKHKDITQSFYPNDMILHSRFEVPEGYDFTLSDIKVEGMPLEWASQIAEQFKVQLAATGIPPTAEAKVPNQFLPVSYLPLPSIGYCMEARLFEVSNENKLFKYSSANPTPIRVNNRTVFKNILIFVDGAYSDKIEIIAMNDEIDFTIRQIKKIGNGSFALLVDAIGKKDTNGSVSICAIQTDTENLRYGVFGKFELDMSAEYSSSDSVKFDLNNMNI